MASQIFYDVSNELVFLLCFSWEKSSLFWRMGEQLGGTHTRKRGLLLRGLGSLTFLLPGLSYSSPLSFLVVERWRPDGGRETLTFWNTLECEQLASLSTYGCSTSGCGGLSRVLRQHGEIGEMCVILWDRTTEKRFLQLPRSNVLYVHRQELPPTSVQNSS
jgi:hypothetical protein